MKKIFFIIILITVFSGCLKVNIKNGFKNKYVMTNYEGISIIVYGVEKKTKYYILYDSPYSIVIKSGADVNFVIKDLVLLQKNNCIELNKNEFLDNEFYYDSEYIDLKHEDFILKLEYQIKTKDKIIDGKIETKMEYERKIYLTCPLWDAMMGI